MSQEEVETKSESQDGIGVGEGVGGDASDSSTGGNKNNKKGEKTVLDAVPTTLETYETNGGFRLYMNDDRKNLDCRFYEERYPEVESVVMVNVRNIADMGAYVSLLEYSNIEGMILLSELSRRRIRSIHKLIRVNRNEVVMVLRVDKEKGYIDLSKRRVSPEDVASCEDRFNKAKAVHGVLRHVAERRHYHLEDLYERIGWPLYTRYGHAFDAFKLAISEEKNTIDPFDELDGDIPTDLKDEIKLYILRRLAPQPIKIRSDIEVSCFTYEGIDAIREALFAGMNVGTTTGGAENDTTTAETAAAAATTTSDDGDDNDNNENENNNHNSNNTTTTPTSTTTDNSQIRIKLIAPPIYVLSTTTLEKDAGITLLNDAIDAIRSTITKKGGKMDVKMAPKAVSIKEENELQAMMDRLALENEEVDGDTPEDE